MRMHVLGCGDAFGSGGRNQSSYLVTAGDRTLLIDCGPTALLAMRRAGLDPNSLDAIILSHLHGDHFGGLPFIFAYHRYEKPRSQPLQVTGPPGTETKVRQLDQLMYGSGAAPRELPFVEFTELSPPARLAIAGMQIEAFRVPHQTNEVSLALRVTVAGKTILFSGDSAWTDEFVTWSREVDLFLCECSFYQPGTTNHIDYLTLRDRLKNISAKRLVLTHLGEEMLQRRKEIAVESAEDGMILEI